MFPHFVLLWPEGATHLLPHPDWEILAWIIGTCVLLIVTPTIYIVSAIRNRGKPKIEHHGHGNLGGLGGYSGRGVGQGGPPGSSPGFFALMGRNSPYGPYGDDPKKEDPHRR